MNKNSKYLYFTTLKQWRNYIQELLSRNDLAVKKAIVAIYKNQTQEEREKFESVERNKRGFDKRDCNYFSCLAVDILNGHELDSDELSYARYKMKRYWRQLMNVSKQNIAQFLSSDEKQENIPQEEETRPTSVFEASEDKIETDKQLDFLDKLLEGYEDGINTNN